MLSLRLLVSAILIPAAVGLFLLDASLGPAAPIFGVLIVVLGSLLASELVTMLQRTTPKLSRTDVVIAVGLMISIGWAAHALPFATDAGTVDVNWTDSQWIRAIAGWVVGDGYGRQSGFHWLSTVTYSVGMGGLIVTIWTAAWFVAAAIKFERGSLRVGEAVPVIAAKIFIVSYAGGTMLLTSQIRWVSVDGFQSMRMLAALLIATKLGDVGAYFLGRLFGRYHPLKTLSPKKTEAGFLGALFCGTLGTGAWLYLTESEFIRVTGRSGMSEFYDFIIFCVPGFLMSALGILGDLVESLVKRDVGVKDASDSLPGFGGFLDLLDSILFTGAVLVGCVTAFSFIVLMFQ